MTEPPVDTTALCWDVGEDLWDRLADLKVADEEFLGWIIEHIEMPVLRLICERDGHVVIDDQCMRPEHRSCARCFVAMPNAAVSPR